MRKMMMLLAVLMLTASAALAETAGSLFPLANTRYVGTDSRSLLRTNGTDAVLFSRGNGVITATRLVEGQNRAGEFLLESSWDMDAVWTGTHFLVAAEGFEGNNSVLLGRLADRNGHPVGQPFVLRSNSQDPRLAAGHGAVLLVCKDTSQTDSTAVLLTPDGRTLRSTPIAGSYSGNAVAATASGFVVITSTSTSTDATRLDPQGRIIARQPVAGPYALHAAATTRGSQSLLVWCMSHRIEVALMRDDGTLGATLTLDTGSEAQPLYPQAPSAVWNGTGWTVVYDGYSPNGRRLNVVHLDAGAGRVLSHEKNTPWAEEPSLASIGGKLYAAWTTNNTTTVPATLPLSAGTPRRATFGAAWQELRLAASSANALLFIWAESGDNAATIRAGTRTNDGQWSEHVLGVDPGYSALLASDSRRFVLIRTFRRSNADETRDTEALFLDEEGRLTGVRTALPFEPEAVAWNGRHYALVDGKGQAVLLAPDGTLSTPVKLNLSFGLSHLASDGNGFLAVGGRIQCGFLVCDPVSVRAIRLTASLEPAGGEIVIEDAASSPGSVVWNGSHYVVLWSGENGTGFTQIAPGSDTAATRQIPLGARISVSAAVAASDGRLATFQFPRPGQAYVVFTTADGTLLDTVATGDDFTSYSPRLVSLGNGSIAYLTAPLHRDAPHHGAKRLAMAVLSGPAIARPAAPRVTVRDDGARFIVEWGAPAGTVNGYRVEYRIDDGVWIEIERWFGPADQSVSVRRPSFGSNFEFRVRAFNDAGASGYSNAAEPAVPKKRRAVR